MGQPAPYFARFRTYAKHASYFHDRIRKLDPVYDNCPALCLAPEADKRNGCPDCDYTLAYNALRANYHKEVEKRFKEAGIDYSPDDDEYGFFLIQRHYRIAAHAEEVAGTESEDAPGGVNPQWTVRMAAAIAIIREERYKVRREKAHEREAELRAQRAAAAKNGK